jgi:hypothetical protein
VLPNVFLSLSPFSGVGLFGERGSMVRALCHSDILEKSRNCGRETLLAAVGRDWYHLLTTFLTSSGERLISI